MQISSWQTQLRESIRDPLALLEQSGLTPGDLPIASRSLEAFPVRVPLHFLSKIRKGEATDPLLRQVLPLIDEDEERPGYAPDPLAEIDSQVAPGVLHKYHGRLLLITTGACAIHCRYCFRRHFPYNGNTLVKNEWSPALDYIRYHPDITEVILSGGDPLTLSDEKLNSLIRQLEEIRHLKRLRIHTRMPSVVPDRITPALLETIKPTRLQTVLVNHCNHPQEIDEKVGSAFGLIRLAGIYLLNQTVLLKNVNDNAGVLITLSERLFDAGVLPYYLHMPDKVAGAAHYDVTQDTAVGIVETLRKQLPGYLVPRLVREIPGAPYKLPIL